MLKIFRNESTRNTFKLVTGTSIAQAIPVLISPILTRLYSPEQFGHFTVFTAVLSAVAILCCLRYEIAIMLPAQIKQVMVLFNISFLLNVLVSVITLMVVAVYFLVIHPVVGKANYFWFLPLAVFLTGTSQIFNNFSNREKQYNSIIRFRIVNSFVVTFTSLLLGYLGFLNFGLYGGFLIGLLIADLFFFKSLYKLLSSHWFKTDKALLQKTALEYSAFPKNNLPVALSDMFQINGIIYLISIFFSQVVVGIYSLAIRILQAPMNLIGSAMAMVFYKDASTAFSEGKNIRPIVKHTMLKSVAIGVPIFLILVFFGPNLFSIAFGEKWREAGVYAKILSPWILLDFVRSPVSQVPIIIGRQRKMLVYSVIANGILIITLVCGGLFLKNVKYTFAMFSLAESLFTIIILQWIYRISDLTLNKTNDAPTLSV